MPLYRSKISVWNIRLFDHLSLFRISIFEFRVYPNPLEDVATETGTHVAKSIPAGDLTLLCPYLQCIESYGTPLVLTWIKTESH
jgi:hypothetical protein